METTSTLPLPSSQQVFWHDLEIGMFIHWAPNVYQDKQSDDLMTPLQEINPYALDTDQWVEVACSLGAKYIVIVAKHLGGFCLWQTDTSEYSIKNTPWRDGNGDIVLDLSRSCAKRGIKLGIYLSPRDEFHKAGVGGVCYLEQEQSSYTELYCKQLTELLTKYGEIIEVWFDGSSEIPVGDILHQYAPDAMIFQSPHATIRWVGNEKGIATYPAWNTLKQKDAASGVATLHHSNTNGDAWMPLECDTTIRADWFWSTTNHTTLRSQKELLELYYRSVGNGAVLLLNANPDPTGKIPDEDALRAKEFGDEIRKRFSNPIAQSSGKGHVIELDLGEKKTIDHVVIMEDIILGERVRVYSVKGWNGSEWVKLCSGTAIGHKRIHRIQPATVCKVRFIVHESAMEPVLRQLSIYHSGVSGEACEQVAEPDAVVVAEWGPELLWQHEGFVTLFVNLKDSIPVAGQYRLSCITYGDKVKVQGFKLFLNNIEYPKYVSYDTNGTQADLFICGTGVPIEARIDLIPGVDFRGIVTIAAI